jgi:hypothetical protein
MNSKRRLNQQPNSALVEVAEGRWEESAVEAENNPLGRMTLNHRDQVKVLGFSNSITKTLLTCHVNIVSYFK